MLAPILILILLQNPMTQFVNELKTAVSANYTIPFSVMRDGDDFIASKIFGNERWGLAWESAGSLWPQSVITGTVVRVKSIIRIFCNVTGVTGPHPRTDSILLECYYNEDLTQATDWHYIGPTRLKGTFFLP